MGAADTETGLRRCFGRSTTRGNRDSRWTFWALTQRHPSNTGSSLQLGKFDPNRYTRYGFPSFPFSFGLGLFLFGSLIWTQRLSPAAG